jgi:hypothetical protein
MQPTPYKHHDLHTERMVLEQFLAEPRWSRPDLRVKLPDIDPDVIDGALAGLIVAGIVTPDRTEMQLAACVPHLDALGMLASAAPNGSPGKGPDKATVDRILAANRQRDDRE